MTAPIVAFSFPAPDKRLNMNDRLHWAKRAGRTKVWRTAGLVAARNWTTRNRSFLPPSAPSLPPCAVKVTFGVPDNRRRDPHNAAPTVKAILDGLVDAGFWLDDTPDQVAVLDSAFEKGHAQVLVECWPLFGGTYATEEHP